MTKEVFVTVEGMQLNTEDEALITAAKGVYHRRNDKHYIHYDIKDTDEVVTKNTIKISPSQIDITKKGIYNTHLVFDIHESTSTYYNTQFGSLLLKIHTNMLHIEDRENEIRIRIGYSLDINGAPASENSIKIRICNNQ